MKPLNSLTREELYDLVWSESLLTLAPKFGISDVALKKRCNNLGIPTPGIGYWAKVQAGKKVKQVELPSSWSPIRKKKHLKKMEDVKTFTPPSESYPTEGLATQAAHWLKGKGSLVTDVTKDHRERAAWLWSGLIGLLKEQGLRLDLAGGCRVTDGTEKVSLELRELTSVYHSPFDRSKDRVWFGETPKTIRETMYNGFLAFRAEEVHSAGCSREWRDTQSTPLDERLGEIAAGLALLLRRKHEIALENEERNRRWEEERRLAALEAERKKIEQKRREKLADMAKASDRADRIRRFAEQFPDGEIKNWAFLVADELDPIKKVQEKLSKGEDPFKEDRPTYYWEC